MSEEDSKLFEGLKESVLDAGKVLRGEDVPGIIIYQGKRVQIKVQPNMSPELLVHLFAAIDMTLSFPEDKLGNLPSPLMEELTALGYEVKE